MSSLPQRKTWPYLAKLHYYTRLERALDDCFGAVVEDLMRDFERVARRGSGGAVADEDHRGGPARRLPGDRPLRIGTEAGAGSTSPSAIQPPPPVQCLGPWAAGRASVTFG